MKEIKYVSEVDLDIPVSMQDEIEDEMVRKLAEQGYDTEDIIEWSYTYSVNVRVKVKDKPSAEDEN